LLTFLSRKKYEINLFGNKKDTMSTLPKREPASSHAYKKAPRQVDTEALAQKITSSSLLSYTRYLDRPTL
jgi:hypothetical protein